MGVFWLVAAAMIGLALAFVLPPMLGRRGGSRLTRRDINLAIYREHLSGLDQDHAAGGLNEEEYSQAREELGRAMLDDLGEGDIQESHSARASTATSPVLPIIIAILVPVAAFGLYFQWGAPAVLFGPSQASPMSAAETGTASAAESGQQVPSVEEMVTQLEERLRNNPENTEGWLMLGRSYAALDRLREARVAFQEAYRQQPANVAVLVGYAEVLGRLNDNNLSGKPTELVRQALQIEPDFDRALWLAGIAAYQRGDNTQAIDLWERLKSLGELGEEEAQLVANFIAQAKDKAAASNDARGAAPAEVPTSASNGAVTVKVSLDPAVAERASPTDSVYIFARAVDGPRIPLAIVRAEVSDLPTTVTLNDGMGMMPELKLSGFSEVIVGARISKTGKAAASPGDLQALSGTVTPGSSEVVQLSIRDVIQ